ncbi:hypothetical protein PHJA_000396500 [Phtheirospermum japonicum]|uniref:Neprosin PEP catalytic domain-containing protein n=1 Tax=Phtheirospermum japonicum TaxID=374723 RepID=A0A830BEZ6_9LAMI|nr:hypothetical protein PHJA_000396500 [Phtheirospermum japonicum]
MSGESCPKNTIPIKRTTEQDVLRATSAQRFGQKTVRRNDVDVTHDHAIGYARGSFFGAQAVVSVWLPKIEHESEFSLSQMWIADGTFKEGNLNTIEVGWKACTHFPSSANL